MTVRPMRFSFAKRSRAARSPALISTLSPISAVPAFPGAQKMRSTPADCASFQTSACSRPPLPTTRIFTGTQRPREPSSKQVWSLLIRRQMTIASWTDEPRLSSLSCVCRRPARKAHHERARSIRPGGSTEKFPATDARRSVRVSERALFPRQARLCERLRAAAAETLIRPRHHADTRFGFGGNTNWLGRSPGIRRGRYPRGRPALSGPGRARRETARENVAA